MPDPPPRGPTRRRVLGALAGALPALLLPPGGRWARAAASKRASAAERGIAALGERLRRSDPAGARRLLEEARARLGAQGLSDGPTSLDRLREQLAPARRVRAELGRGDLVECGGWLLARSEARLAVAWDSAERT